MSKLWRRIAIGAGIALLVIQVVPYGRSHTNPPITQEPAWNAPETRALAERACFDCHSNETRWPWYASVAPVSWLTERDVSDGRRHLNFSEWDRQQRHAKDSAKEVRHGDMPLWFYVPLHPEARLNPEEKQTLIAGLEATFGVEDESESSEHGSR